METVKGLTELLQVAGGWGVAVIAIYGLVRVYLDKAQDNKDLGALLELRHAQFVTMMEESIRLKTALTGLMERNLEVHERMIDMLSRVDRAIASCERVGGAQDGD